MDIHLLVCCSVTFVMSTVMTSYALSNGPGRCWNTISALITVRETFTESLTKRTATCCDWFCTSKCSSYRVVYKTAYRNALRTKYKIDMGCCPGWRPQEGHCVPATIPDGRAEATLVPFQPGVPPGQPRSSGAHHDTADTGSGKSHLGKNGGRNQQAGSTVNQKPSLPGRGSSQEGEVYIIKKLRSDAWATSHPVEMSIIVGMLGLVVVVVLVCWTMYKRRLARDHSAMIHLYKADERQVFYETGTFQYEVLPKPIDGNQLTQISSTPSTSAPPEENIYQNYPLFKSRGFRYRNTEVQATEPSPCMLQKQRGSVYEINLPEVDECDRYTLLNVGGRESASSYTPLQLDIESTPSTSKEET